MTFWVPRQSGALALLAATLLLGAGCGAQTEADYPNQITSKPGEIVYDSEIAKKGEDSVFGSTGLNLLDIGKPKKGGGGGGGIGVNSYLWRASLDTISFMPLVSADPFGGVIITDWYVPPETPGERYKMNVYIMDRQLRADGIRVAVIRQKSVQGHGWINETVAPATATNLENQILTRARQLRLAATGQAGK